MIEYSTTDRDFDGDQYQYFRVHGLSEFSEYLGVADNDASIEFFRADPPIGTEFKVSVRSGTDDGIKALSIYYCVTATEENNRIDSGFDCAIAGNFKLGANEEF